ncbi:response regulator [Candidatus Saccharibacteria bacterium]|nr:response regulator [Candidatus Saccharibacteria bacterium]
MKRIYVVEDDDLLALHYKRLLNGYDVRVFSNGIDAMAAIDKNLPSCIVLDLMLDGPSGFALLNELQSYTDTAKIPIIVCSNLASELGGQLQGYNISYIIDKTTMSVDDLRQAVHELTN